jgi:two-component system phosphate regulon response regulator PhoB
LPERIAGWPMSDQPFPAPILVVEDEGDLRALIGYNLSRSGYAVELTADLCSARQVLECATPSLVILDLMLPDGSGLELARQIRRSPLSASIPILFVTARPKETYLRSCRFSSQDDYLAKPFSVRELLRRVQAQVQLSGSGPEREESKS